ncbi:hypothetical protein [Agrobacterium sp. 10MFCol1.1]|uniref:hypothetical protein n=1 Tax=Agrobacterium sp. 10MFCol1.1 TaxID=1150775 RepID=UPI0003671B41
MADTKYEKVWVQNIKGMLRGVQFTDEMKVACLREFEAFISAAEKREKEAKTGWAFDEGDLVRKKSGSWWEGRVVGTYTTEQTPRGYAVQLDKPFGPVQIYPESALESALQSEER